MIRYALVCDNAHEFESWFASSSSFEDQVRRGLVACPLCGSKHVDRAIMAPNVARTDRSARAIEVEPQVSPVAAAPTPAPAAPAALMGEQEIALRQMLTDLHKHVAENAEHVGPRFADEALKIHHGESDSRPIYGEATSEDARMLHEEGVEFMPLPRLPGTSN
jgi:hypothetical protein